MHLPKTGTNFSLIPTDICHQSGWRKIIQAHASQPRRAPRAGLVVSTPGRGGDDTHVGFISPVSPLWETENQNMGQLEQMRLMRPKTLWLSKCRSTCVGIRTTWLLALTIGRVADERVNLPNIGGAHKVARMKCKETKQCLEKLDFPAALFGLKCALCQKHHDLWLQKATVI